MEKRTRWPPRLMLGNNTEERVLVVAPVGQDAAVMATLLREQGFHSHPCVGAADAVTEMQDGAGALLVTEEALELLHFCNVFELLKAQPPWSELPLIILTSGGESRRARLLDRAASAAGAITLIERPMTAATLLRTTEAALHARRRQYQVRDLLEEQRAKQRQLRESEEHYRTPVSQVKDYAIFRTDTEGRAISWNEGVRRVLGFEEVDFIGADITTAIFTPEDIEARVPQRELQTAAREGSANNDRWMRRKDGSTFFASGITTALKDPSGTIVGFSKVLRDVTDMKQAQERLQQIVAERTSDLRDTNEQLEAFVYSIAHDLRAPLRSMTGYSQLLLDDHAAELADSGKQMLKRIQVSSEFMDKLLIDLLAYGRTARAEMQLDPVDVKHAWNTAILQCAIQIEQTRAEIETVEPLPAVRAHEATLGQILANLLSNSLKFMTPGTRPRIRLRPERNDNFIRLWIEDNGPGIPAHQHERIFRVFERLDGARHSGTGIGLSIVRKGVERMGGRAGVESEAGEGSRFWIELQPAGA